jgi:hypothetical protein
MHIASVCNFLDGYRDCKSKYYLFKLH